MLKYDYNPLPIDHKVDNRVASSLKKFFVDMAGSIPVAGWQPVFDKIKPKSSSGLSPSKDKQDHLRKYLTSVLAYWNTAHLAFYRCLWKCVPKEEILPDEKLDNNDLRVFLIPPADQYFSHARIAHNFDEYVLDTFGEGKRPFGYGVSIHTYRAHLKPLLKFKYVGYSDARRYDATVGHNEFVVDIVDIRRFCHDSSSMPLVEFELRLRYYMDECSVTYVLTPSGEIYEKVGGAPSGKKSTTMDNSIIHLKRWIQVMWFRLDRCLFELIQQGDIWLSIFGDDVVFGLSEALYQSLGWADYTVYQRDFLRTGMIVKPEMYIGTNIHELTYLGMRLGKDDEGITLQFPPEKLLAAVLRPKRFFTVEDNIQLLNSLSLLCPYDRGMYNLLTDKVKELGAKPQYTFDGVRFMWTGFEAGEDLRSLRSNSSVINLSDPATFCEFVQTVNGFQEDLQESRA